MTLTEVLQAASQEAVADAVQEYRKPTTTELVEATGRLTGETMKRMCDEVAEHVRKACQQAVEMAAQVQADGEIFATTLTEVGQQHADRLNDFAKHMQSLVTLIEAEKAKMAALTMTTTVN